MSLISSLLVSFFFVAILGIGILAGPEPVDICRSISRDTCIIKSCVFQSTVNVLAPYNNYIWKAQGVPQ